MGGRLSCCEDVLSVTPRPTPGVPTEKARPVQCVREVNVSQPLP